jgi:hypothetical protein
MKSRLEALLRQRELLREHVQWLDEEIAAERARVSAAAPATSTVRPLPTPAPQPTVASATPAIATAPLPAEADVKGLHNEVRRGCFVYLSIATVLLAALVAFIYWKYGSHADDVHEPAPPTTEIAPAGAPGAPR